MQGCDVRRGFRADRYQQNPGLDRSETGHAAAHVSGCCGSYRRSRIESGTPTERIAGNAIFLALSEDGTESPFISKTYSFDLSRRMLEEGEDPVMPVVETTEDQVLNIDKVALMDKNKVKYILTPDETRLYNLLDLRNLSTNFGTKIGGKLLEVNTDRTRARYKIVTDKRGKKRLIIR